MKECVKKTKDRISQIESSVHALPNTVPSDFKVTFNYKGRKSMDIASEVISRLTNDSSVVFDPFFGSGSFILAAAKTKVKEIIGTAIIIATRTKSRKLRVYTAKKSKLQTSVAPTVRVNWKKNSTKSRAFLQPSISSICASY